MDIDTLRQFLVLSECLNFSKAAKQLNISQSALSKHIQSLENELGNQLLIRDSHQVKLTAIGSVFANKMRDLLAEYDGLITIINDMGESIRSVLNIGIILAAPQKIIADACRLFRNLSPETKLHVYTFEPEEMIEKLNDGTIDLGITLALTESVPSNMVFNVLEWQRFGALMDYRNPKAALQKISTADLSDEKILIPSQSRFPTISVITSNILRDSFERANIISDTTDIGCMGPIISAYDYIALTYECVTRLFDEGYIFIPLTDIDIRAAIGFMWKESNEDASIRLFVDCLNKTKAI